MKPQTISIICLTLLTLQNSSQSLVSRYSRGILHENYSAWTVVFMNEIVKLLISMIGTIITRRNEQPKIGNHFILLLKTSLVSSVPALIYLIQNVLYLVALENIPAELYSVLSQLKILSAAILSYLIIKKQISQKQWASLVLLVVSVTIVENASRSTMSQNTTEFTFGNYIIGVGSCLLVVLISGFS